MKIRTFVIPLIIILLGVGAMFLLISLKEEPPKREFAPRPKIVETKVVRLSNIQSEIIAYGRLRSAQPVLLISEVDGKLMSGSIPFQPGQPFNKGDLLIKIDDRQIKLDINSAKSDLLTALSSVLPEIKVDFPEKFSIWEDYFDNIEFDKPLESLPEVKEQKIKLFLSRFNVYKLFFNVQNLEIRLSKHYFYAPFSGSIVSADLRLGSTARSGTRLGEIINLEDLEVEVPVPAQDVQWIDRKKPVYFTSNEVSGRWKGFIKRIGRSIDTQTQTVPVYMSIDKSQSSHIYNGVFLTAHIPGDVIPNSTVVPQKALYNQKNVYLIKNGKLDYREVDIARKQTDLVIIRAGVADGDTLVTEVMQGVAPGMLARSKPTSIAE